MTEIKMSAQIMIEKLECSLFELCRSRSAHKNDAHQGWRNLFVADSPDSPDWPDRPNDPDCAIILIVLIALIVLVVLLVVIVPVIQIILNVPIVLNVPSSKTRKWRIQGSIRRLRRYSSRPAHGGDGSVAPGVYRHYLLPLTLASTDGVIPAKTFRH